MTLAIQIVTLLGNTCWLFVGIAFAVELHQGRRRRKTAERAAEQYRRQVDSALSRLAGLSNMTAYNDSEAN